MKMPPGPVKGILKNFLQRYTTTLRPCSLHT
ncbi:hypothetical protein C7408_1491 [Paraburkholderia caballeronis]|uniref:Uncharacterized protein n=1 Tax=Paraburkholderia caballeronis TaxID=416943 RepID=A0A1H7WCZ5_9BURK|nr:hypothetical protein C7403_1321 [Paraburkholderia caballeronis]PXW92379.1 hypothetical protein C7407_1341 [Paraburkholderia caballeronis]RAJ86583.1 hypothetical protein C7409_1341 [Paraburkholderia caballeronis]TDV01685.1 hypothetical protein C7408_1491 [Paraburkholderia caballeronis]TDV06167.1 hypothetical protein C7406_1471 [Paraburkholderia caballeronis]